MPEAKVLQLVRKEEPKAPERANVAVVKQIELLLEKAREGKMAAVAFVGINLDSDGRLLGASDGWCGLVGAGPTLALMGGLDVLKTRIMAATIDFTEDDEEPEPSPGHHDDGS